MSGFFRLTFLSKRLYIKNKNQNKKIMEELIGLFNVLPVYITLVFLFVLGTILAVVTKPPRKWFIHILLALGLLAMLALVFSVFQEEFRIATILVFSFGLGLRFVLGK